MICPAEFLSRPTCLSERSPVHAPVAPLNSERHTVKKALRAALLSLPLLAPASIAAVAQANITSPEEAFGFKPGTDRKLADWVELVGYYKKLAGETDRIHYEELGKTTEGRPFVALTISSPENLAHLDEYKAITKQLSDARVISPDQATELIGKGKMILVVTCAVHSTEIASSQTASDFAYRMASSQDPEVLDELKNVILVLVPSLNPDGTQLVVDWYKKYLGTPYEGFNPPVVYNKYVGHDDNRDWYSFTQVETRLLVDKVLNAFHPQILYDLHQMGALGPRIYMPPWVDPHRPQCGPYSAVVDEQRGHVDGSRRGARWAARRADQRCV